VIVSGDTDDVREISKSVNSSQKNLNIKNKLLHVHELCVLGGGGANSYTKKCNYTIMFMLSH
jgi:hypothetical protein